MHIHFLIVVYLICAQVIIKEATHMTVQIHVPLLDNDFLECLIDVNTHCSLYKHAIYIPHHCQVSCTCSLLQLPILYVSCRLINPWLSGITRRLKLPGTVHTCQSSQSVAVAIVDLVCVRPDEVGCLIDELMIWTRTVSTLYFTLN